jgi:hypothetical protein
MVPMAPRILDKVVQVHRPPRQAKAGLAPGKGALPGAGAAGQPPFIPTDEQRVRARRLVACGFTQESISVIMSIPLATLERHFPFELQNGKLMTDAKILGGIVTQAEEGDKTMSIFWAKARSGWRDVGKDSDAPGASAVFAININNGPETNESHRIVVTHLPKPDDEPP